MRYVKFGSLFKLQTFWFKLLYTLVLIVRALVSYSEVGYQSMPDVEASYQYF